MADTGDDNGVGTVGNKGIGSGGADEATTGALVDKDGNMSRFVLALYVELDATCA